MADHEQDDERLLAELGAALHEADDVPEWFLDTARSALEWYTLDAELAMLTHDSATTPELAGARAEPLSVHSLTFSGPETTIAVEVDPDALRGQVAPRRAGEMELRPRDGRIVKVPVDEDGWFEVRPKPAGAFRLLFRSVDGQVVLTGWVSV
jgi:hypothetical protein